MVCLTESIFVQCIYRTYTVVFKNLNNGTGMMAVSIPGIDSIQNSKLYQYTTVYLVYQGIPLSTVVKYRLLTGIGFPDLPLYTALAFVSTSDYKSGNQF